MCMQFVDILLTEYRRVACADTAHCFGANEFLFFVPLLLLFHFVTYK